MRNISSLTAHSESVELKQRDISTSREIFPPPVSDFTPLFDAHGHEVRGKPFRLDYKRYAQLEFEGRLVWIVARNHLLDGRPPVGYSCHWWYRDMHFDERCAADDLWYVSPEYRCQGIGHRLKSMGHRFLKLAGVTRIADNIRYDGVTSHLMHELGFEGWGTRWLKTFPGGSGS